MRGRCILHRAGPFRRRPSAASANVYVLLLFYQQNAVKSTAFPHIFCSFGKFFRVRAKYRRKGPDLLWERKTAQSVLRAVSAVGCSCRGWRLRAALPAACAAQGMPPAAYPLFSVSPSKVNAPERISCANAIESSGSVSLRMPAVPSSPGRWQSEPAVRTSP